MRPLATVVALICCVAGGLSLDINRLEVPQYVDAGDDATLECDFDLEGNGLYAVKWYHNGREFYRFMPSNSQPGRAFSDVHGIEVDESSSNERRVVLRNLSVESGGHYTCEVTSEAPTFQVVKFTAVMRVFEPVSGVMMRSVGGVKTGGVISWLMLFLMILVAVAARRATGQHLTTNL